ncbi:MAG: transposase [Planctomycetota bacterium]|nr:transposase [Planctomycetota bacterium]
MRPLTPRQQAVLEFVGAFSRDRGFAPSLREIGQAVGLTNVSAVRGHVAALEKKGFVRKQPDQPRSISVVHAPSLLSRIKRTLHQCARTDEGVLHHVQYGLVLASQGLAPRFAPDAKADVEKALERLAKEHGWRFVRKQIHPDHLVLVVQVWPNHSPALAAARVRAAGEKALRRRGQPADRRAWARGYVATTDLDQLDDMAEHFLAARRPPRREGAKG